MVQKMDFQNANKRSKGRIVSIHVSLLSLLCTSLIDSAALIPYAEVGTITTVQLFQLLLCQHAVTLSFLIILVDEGMEMSLHGISKRNGAPKT